ncbi:MAG: prepilin-type N-terminal cleavage/methylation domain-containing protein [Phycisphaerae bacterium]|nr:prepilin-type N-terminal cleavage/methylation domain-containing protein [Phycisphaerae bacterium]
MRTCGPRAFTLVEVTISIALALVLMLGVSQVFRVAGDAIGTGQALADALRDSRAAQVVLDRDMQGAVTYAAPYFLINCQGIFSYENHQQDISDADQHVWTVNDPAVAGNSIPLSTISVNSQHHRFDSMSFFYRGLLYRQTGNDGTYVDNLASREGFITYGMAWQPDNTGTFTTQTIISNGTPGTNPNNLYGSQWILARQALLLVKPASNGAIYDSGTISQDYYQRPSNASSSDLSPLDFTNTKSTKLVSPNTYALNECRYDLAGTTISDYLSIVRTAIANNQTFYSAVSNQLKVNPVVLGPPTSAMMAQQSPILVRGCSQFIVEFAGDFLSQDATTGKVTGTYAYKDASNNTVYQPTDGVTDYYIDTAGNRQIQWYGLPRSTAGKSTVTAANGDVVFLHDLWVTAPALGSGTALPTAPCERSIGMTPAPSGNSLTYDYEANNKATANANTRYTCAFGPSDPKPRMIRITMTIDDPGGRLGDGQTYQYVFTLQQ